MGLLSLLKKEQPQDLCAMSKKEKKYFLANDLIERMIRIEQKLSGSFGGGFVPYYQTEYFKSLTDFEKSRFKKYLSEKEKRTKWRFLPWVFLAGGGFVLGSRITGNVVGASGDISPMNLILIGVLIAFALIYLAILVAKKHRWEKLDKHFSVVERIISKRRIRRD
jgi:hypothetical protein